MSQVDSSLDLAAATHVNLTRDGGVQTYVVAEAQLESRGHRTRTNPSYALLWAPLSDLGAAPVPRSTGREPASMALQISVRVPD